MLGSIAGSGFQSIMYTSEVCTGDPSKIRNAMESFPSGHSQIAFAGLFYVAMYLNAHLRVVSFSANPAYRRPRHSKTLAVIAPVLLSTYLASMLVLGHHLHWYDVLFGVFIGSVMAVWAYKMVFMSVWDGRTNCVLLRDREDEADGARANGEDSVLPRTTQGARNSLPWLVVSAGAHE
jgi:diacylglycerol diphosphate phosphatase / phosphatidate phosphatase